MIHSSPTSTSAARRRAVVLLARPPRAEARAKGLGRAEAVFALGRDRALAAAAAVEGARVVVVGHLGAGAESVPDLLHLPQRGVSFGERLEHALCDTRRLGFDQLVLVGLDHPGLEAADLTEAFRLLERRSSVLGPARDGGAYLVGVRGPQRRWRRWIRAVRWQTSHVLEDWRAQAPDAALLTRELTDLDEAADLRHLATAAPRDAVLHWLLDRLRAPRPLRTTTLDAPRRAAAPSSCLSRRGPPRAA